MVLAAVVDATARARKTREAASAGAVKADGENAAMPKIAETALAKASLSIRTTRGCRAAGARTERNLDVDRVVVGQREDGRGMWDIAQVERVIALASPVSRSTLRSRARRTKLASGLDSITTTRFPASVSRLMTALPIFPRRKR